MSTNIYEMRLKQRGRKKLFSSSRSPSVSDATRELFFGSYGWYQPRLCYAFHLTVLVCNRSGWISIAFSSPSSSSSCAMVAIISWFLQCQRFRAPLQWTAAAVASGGVVHIALQVVPIPNVSHVRRLVLDPRQK
jgi:hypothetical protein